MDRSAYSTKNPRPLTQEDALRIIRRFEKYVPAQVWRNRCWAWQGNIAKNGYGRINIGGTLYFAHRVSWTLYRGEIPAGLTIDHLCRNRACVNPHHLEPVPHGVNVLRTDNPFALNARKTHCIHGHELPVKMPGVSRTCVECRRRRDRARRKAA